MAKQGLAEVFSTMNGKVFQDNQKLSFLVEWKGVQSSYKLPCFFGLKRRIDAIDLVGMLNDPSAGYDFEVVAPCGSDRCFVLTIPEIIEFRSLLAGARVMLELNSIIYECLHRPVLC